MTTIHTFTAGGVNAYLVRTAPDACVLIDCGFPQHTTQLTAFLTQHGCAPGQLKHIFLTHGDVDHVGSAAHLRQQHGAPIHIHPADAPMLTAGDMALNRKSPPDRVSLLFRLFQLVDRTPRLDTFAADHLLTDGDDLTPLGFPARVIAIPGHSAGSVGFLTPGGDFFCGDLLMNVFGPALQMFLDDLPAAHASLAKLRPLPITTVYPGHGQPFPIAALWRRNPR